MIAPPGRRRRGVSPRRPARRCPGCGRPPSPSQLLEGRRAGRVRRVGVEVHPEQVLPARPAGRPGPRLEPRQVEPAAREGPERAMERPGDVAHGEDQRRPRRAVGRPGSRGRDDPRRLAGPRDHREPGAVVAAALDVVGQHLEAVDPGDPRRRDGGRAALAALGDLLRGAGRVVGRLDAPRARPQELVRLGERRRDRVHALDAVERLAGQRRAARAGPGPRPRRRSAARTTTAGRGSRGSCPAASSRPGRRPRRPRRRGRPRRRCGTRTARGPPGAAKNRSTASSANAPGSPVIGDPEAAA